MLGAILDRSYGSRAPSESIYRSCFRIACAVQAPCNRHAERRTPLLAACRTVHVNGSAVGKGHCAKLAPGNTVDLCGGVSKNLVFQARPRLRTLAHVLNFTLHDVPVWGGAMPPPLTGGVCYRCQCKFITLIGDA